MNAHLCQYRSHKKCQENKVIANTCPKSIQGHIKRVMVIFLENGGNIIHHVFP